MCSIRNRVILGTVSCEVVVDLDISGTSMTVAMGLVMSITVMSMMCWMLDGKMVREYLICLCHE